MKNVIKFFSLFVIIFAFFSTVQAYNLEYKATKTKIDKDKTVLRVKMSAGASEDSINSWNEISKNWNKYVKSGKIDDDGYYLSNDGGSCNTGRGDYNSVYTTFHKLDDLTTTYYTKPVNDCVRINYLTKVNGSKKDYKVAYVSRNSGNNPKTPNYAQFDTSDVSYGWKVSNGTQTFIRQFSLSQINTICKTFKLDKTKKSKLRLSTIGCSNDERFASSYFSTKTYGRGVYMDSAWKYYRTISGIWFTYTYGYEHVSGNNGWATGDKYIDPRNCTANEYDNIITIPAIDESDTYVYVRHRIEGGNVTLEDVITGKHILSNGKEADNTGATGGYPETYKLGKNQTISLDYAGDEIEVNGKIYKFVKSMYGVSKINKDDAKDNRTTRGTEHALTAESENKKQYIIIEYVYREVEPPPPVEIETDIEAKLRLEGQINNSDKTISISAIEQGVQCKTNAKDEDKKVLYVPAGEQVKFIINAPMYYFKSIKQSSESDYINGQSTWKVDCEVYVLDETVVKNASGSTPSFFGSGKNNVLNLSNNYSYKKDISGDYTSKVVDAIKNKLSGYVGINASTMQENTTIDNGASVDISSEYQTIDAYNYNGKRGITGLVKYKLYTFSYSPTYPIEEKKFNNPQSRAGYIDSNTNNFKEASQYIKDNVTNETVTEEQIEKNKKDEKLKDHTYTYYVKGYVRSKSCSSGTAVADEGLEEHPTNSTNLNIYTPLSVDGVSISGDSQTVVNHSNKSDVTQIQKGSNFTIDPSKAAEINYPGASPFNASKYAGSYIYLFDFDIKLNDGREVLAGQPIEIAAPGILNATVTGDINQTNNSYKIMGITRNEPTASGYLENEDFEEAIDDELSTTDIESVGGSGNSRLGTSTSSTVYNYKKFIDKKYIGYITMQNSGVCNTTIYNNLIPGIGNLKEGAFYRVVTNGVTQNVGRIYGFRVTDCSDVNWKNVFRKTDSSGKVNAVTGTVYFSGKKVYNYVSNKMENAVDKTGKTNIIPLAPYKSTNNSYIEAPKLGYRISFDLKTSGFYDYRDAPSSAQRYITIKPSYYFIKKNGTGYNENIDLYYKNSSGKYIKFVGSNYNISFIPKDGYRHTFDNGTQYQFNTDIMATKLLTLPISSASGFNLISGNGTSNRGMMAIDEVSNYGSVQVWFGEFKLPNSTIAVNKGQSINSPLKDGYIGVKFDITCTDSRTGLILNYNQANKNSSAQNTTQWDYDAYLGFNSPGSSASNLKIQLEKGTWNIDNAMYQNIKGTVILYDADRRAANDFE